MLGVTQGTVSRVHTVNVFYDHTVIISITYRIKASQVRFIIYRQVCETISHHCIFLQFPQYRLKLKG